MRTAGLIALTLSVAFGQSADERPRFEVASIRMYPSGAPFRMGGAGATPDGFRAQYTMLKSLLEYAYDVREAVGPDWITERYDIDAKAAGPIPAAQVKPALQALLEGRFKLKVHRETKDMPAAVLVTGKHGPKNLQPVQAGIRPQVQRVDGRLVFKQAPMSFIAMSLGLYPPYGVNERVYDQTGIEGFFDLTLTVSDFNSDHEFNLSSPGGKYQEMKSAAFVFFSTLLEKEYGLKLEHRKVPLETLVVDSGNKIPTEN